jgi:hypothetical protein
MPYSEEPIRKIVFIGGIDLCGSTILDLAIGSRPGVLSLGEIDNLLEPEKRLRAERSAGPARFQRCTCGEVGSECILWGEIVSADNIEGFNYGKNLNKLLTRICDVLPRVHTLVDSSKEPSALLRLIRSIDVDQAFAPEVCVIVFRRNPWSWLASDSKRARRRGRIRTWRIRIRRLKKWDERYRKLRSLENELGYRFLYANLHSFQRAPATYLRRFFNPLGLPEEGESSDAAAQIAPHILWGSHHRHNPKRKTVIDRGEKLTLIEVLEFCGASITTPRVFWTNLQLILLELRK